MSEPESLGRSSAPRAETSRLPLGDLLVAFGVLALGGYFAYGALSISVVQTYARVGPRFFPLLVAGGLLVCGALLLVQALRGRAAPPEEGEDVDLDAPPDYRVVAAIMGALALYALLLEPAGFVPASAALFWGVALAFGSRSWLRDPLIGLVLSLVVYGAFTRLLGLRLPAGVLAPLGL